MTKIRVLIADDHEVVRDGLKHVLGNQTDIEVVGEAEDGFDAVKKVKAIKPDVVLLDISMPRLNGIEAVQLIRESVPKSKIIVLSMHKKEPYVHKLLSGGVLGYVLKASPSTELISAIRAVSRGEYYLSPAISQEVVSGYVEKWGVKSAKLNKDVLSDRENQVLRLTVDGNSINQTAEILSLSPKTVERHRANIMKKLKINNIVEMMKYAIEFNIIDPEMWAK
jgi:DNA-binding NarL/FixJ family response regulator